MTCWHLYSGLANGHGDQEDGRRSDDDRPLDAGHALSLPVVVAATAMRALTANATAVRRACRHRARGDGDVR